MAQQANIFDEIAKTLTKCQTSAAAHPKLIEHLRDLLAKSNFDTFYEKFERCLGFALVTSQKNVHVDRFLDFVAKFAASLTVQTTTTTTGSQNANDEDRTLPAEEDQFENPLFSRLVEFLIKSSEANYDAVRYRSCQLLSRLIGALNNDQLLDEDMFNRLCDTLIQRLKDISSKVQTLKIQAISAITRLQDPTDRECRVIKALQFLMDYDPNWQVRWQALAYIAYSKFTLPSIIDRVRDPSPHVRKKALLTLSEKVLIKFISIERRLFILNCSLNDSDEGVVEVATRKLLASWLTFKENDVCKLLKALDVIQATSTCELMLERLHADDPLEAIFATFGPALLDEKLLVPLDKLEPESALYWRWIAARCKAVTTGDPTTVSNDQKVEAQNIFDKIVPNLTDFCGYFRQVMNKLLIEQSAERSSEAIQQHENAEFILRQLLQMFLFIDFSDAFGHRALQKLCEDLLSRRDLDFLFEPVMEVFRRINPNLQQRVNQLVELISDIREPTNQQTQPKTPTAATTAQEDDETAVVDKTLVESDEQSFDPSSLRLKISELQFKRFQLKEAFETLFQELKKVDCKVDMNRLTEAREALRECEDEIAGLKAKLEGGGGGQKAEAAGKKDATEPVNPLELSAIHPEPPAQTQSPAADPIEVTLHCLRLVLCMLQDPELKTLSAPLRSLLDSFVLIHVTSVCEQIRALAIRALGLICLLNLELAQRYMHLFLKVIEKDKKEMVLEAFQAIIGCIMAFTLNKLFSTDAEMSMSKSTTDQDINSSQHHAAMSRMLSQLTAMLDNQDPEVSTIAVEGFCKLYMTGHIVSAKLFSKLLMLYFSPLTEGDAKLRSILSHFLPQFAFMRASNQVCVEESFMVTLKFLVNAAPDSLLSGIDLIKVVELLWQLTNPKNLFQQRRQGIARQTNNICHENIARSICGEILNEENAFKCKTYLKVVQMADLTDADYHTLKDIRRMADEIQETTTDRLNKKAAQKFCESLEAIMIKKPEYEEEQERKRVEAEQRANSSSVADSSQASSQIRPSGSEQPPENSQMGGAGGRKAREQDSDNDENQDDPSSPKLLDPMFKRLNKKAKKVDESKKVAKPKAAAAAEATVPKTPANKKSAAKRAAAEAETPEETTVIHETPQSRTSTRLAKQQAIEPESASPSLKSKEGSNADESSILKPRRSSRVPTTKLNVSKTATDSEETPVVKPKRASRATSKQDDDSKDKTSSSKPSARSRAKTNIEKAATTAPAPAPVEAKRASRTSSKPTVSEVVPDTDEENEDTPRRSSRVQSKSKPVEQVQKASNQAGTSTIVISSRTRASRATAEPAKDEEPPVKVLRGSPDTRVSKLQRQETRTRVTRSSSGHKLANSSK